MVRAHTDTHNHVLLILIPFLGYSQPCCPLLPGPLPLHKQFSLLLSQVGHHSPFYLFKPLKIISFSLTVPFLLYFLLYLVFSFNMIFSYKYFLAKSCLHFSLQLNKISLYIWITFFFLTFYLLVDIQVGSMSQLLLIINNRYRCMSVFGMPI